MLSEQYLSVYTRRMTQVASDERRGRKHSEKKGTGKRIYIYKSRTKYSAAAILRRYFSNVILTLGGALYGAFLQRPFAHSTAAKMKLSMLSSLLGSPVSCVLWTTSANLVSSLFTLGSPITHSIYRPLSILSTATYFFCFFLLSTSLFLLSSSPFIVVVFLFLTISAFCLYFFRSYFFLLLLHIIRLPCGSVVEIIQPNAARWCHMGSNQIKLKYYIVGKSGNKNKLSIYIYCFE